MLIDAFVGKIVWGSLGGFFVGLLAGAFHIMAEYPISYLAALGIGWDAVEQLGRQAGEALAGTSLGEMLCRFL